MKVYISADIEGITGIADWDEADRGKADWAWFRDRMAKEVAAACAGAWAAGATEVWVKDAHATGRNLRPDDLPRGTRLIRGWAGHPFQMVQELDPSFRALAFVGYHSRAGSPDHPLAHTMTGRFARITVDGEPLSEFRLHQRIGQMLGVPAVFLSGDAALCEASAGEVPGLVTVATHRGVGNSVVAESPDQILEAIAAGMERAVRAAPTAVPPLPDRPTGYTVDVRFRRPFEAYKASFFPGAQTVEEGTVRLVAHDWFEVARALLFL